MVNVPSSSDLRARYPEFEPVSHTRLTLFIDEASRRVDDSWLEADQSPAILNLACHLLSLEGEPSASVDGVSNSANTNLKNGRFLKSRKVGDVSNEWAESAASAAVGAMSKTALQAGYNSTPYGAKFLSIMKLNHSGARVV